MNGDVNLDLDLDQIVVGSKMRFVPRRNAENRCSECGEVFWDDILLGVHGAVVTVDYEAEGSLTIHFGENSCGKVVVAAAGTYGITFEDGRVSVVPFTWLQPLDAPYDPSAYVMGVDPGIGTTQ